ncbi:MAG: molybdenum cofactor biosynthesis protein MoaE, partial [Thermoplasmata archaeon]
NENIDFLKMINDINSKKNGAIVTFIGTVRDENNGKNVKKIIYDAYFPMAIQEMENVCKESIEKFGILDVNVHHRIGEFYPGETVLFIAVSSAHREEGFNACRYIIDKIKERVPIWKKEFYEDSSAWIIPP